MKWNDPKIELPKKLDNTNETQPILARKMEFSKDGYKHYRYYIATYNFLWEKFFDYNTNKNREINNIIYIDEWCELQNPIKENEKEIGILKILSGIGKHAYVKDCLENKKPIETHSDAKCNMCSIFGCGYEYLCTGCG